MEDILTGNKIVVFVECVLVVTILFASFLLVLGNTYPDWQQKAVNNGFVYYSKDAGKFIWKVKD